MQSVWFSRRAILLHVALGVAVPSFFVLAAWQLKRALSGNLLSWAYVFEWPFFAAYAGYMWWKLIHEPVLAVPEAAARKDQANLAEVALGRGKVRPNVPVPRSGFDPYDESDPKLAAYNRYLASLHEPSES